MAPEYKKAASTVKGMVNIVAVDCDDAANRPLCSRYDVKGKVIAWPVAFETF